jgi:hypothetical protein
MGRIPVALVPRESEVHGLTGPACSLGLWGRRASATLARIPLMQLDNTGVAPREVRRLDQHLNAKRKPRRGGSRVPTNRRRICRASNELREPPERAGCPVPLGLRMILENVAWTSPLRSSYTRP